MVKYFVKTGEKIIGPISLEEIQSKVESKEINHNDTMFLESKDHWISIGEMLSAPNNTTQASTANTSINSNEWYILRGEDKYGPYPYLQIIKMLQDKDLMEYEYVWTTNLSKWSRIADLRDFSPERVQVLVNEHKDIFYKRAFQRVPLEAEIILLDSFKAWKGKNLILSEGGCCVKVLNSMIQPGDEVYIHFKPNAQLPAFRVKGEIVSKKFDPNIRDIEHPIEYGVRFIDLQKMMQQELKKVLSKRA